MQEEIIVENGIKSILQKIFDYYYSYKRTCKTVALGELVNDTYESFSLESGVETQIAYGTGAYYICGPVSDTLSCIAVVNYYSVATLGVVGGLTFRVAERTLYATSDGAADIRVKKIRTKS